VANPPPVILSLLSGNPAYSSMNIGGYLTSSSTSSAAVASSLFSTKIDLLSQSSNYTLPGSISQSGSLGSLLGSTKGTSPSQLRTSLFLQATAPKDLTVSSYNIATSKTKTVSPQNSFVSLLNSPETSILNYFTVKTTESKAPPSGTANTLAQYIGGPHNNVFTSTPTTYTTTVKSNNPILSGWNSNSTATVPTTGFENLVHSQLYLQTQTGIATAESTYGSMITTPKASVLSTLEGFGIGAIASAGTIGWGLYAPSASLTQRLTAAGTLAVIALPIGQGIGAIAGGAAAGAVFTEGSSLISTGRSASGTSLVVSAITAGAFVGAGELVSKFTPEIYAAATGKTVFYKNTLSDYVAKYGTNAATADFSKTLNYFGADTSKAYIFADRSGVIAKEGGLFYNAVNMGHMQASDIQSYLGRVEKNTGSSFRLATTSEGPLGDTVTVTGKAAGQEHFGGVRKFASGPQEGMYFNLPSLEGRAINLNYNQNIMARAAGDVGSSNVRFKFSLNPFAAKGGLLSTGVDTSDIAFNRISQFTKETGIDVTTPEGKTAFSQWLGKKAAAQGKSFHIPYQNYFPGTDEAQTMANVGSKIASMSTQTAVFKSDFSHTLILKLNTAGTAEEAEGSMTSRIATPGKSTLTTAYNNAVSLSSQSTKIVSLWSGSIITPIGASIGAASSSSGIASAPSSGSLYSSIGIDPAIISSSASNSRQSQARSMGSVSGNSVSTLSIGRSPSSTASSASSSPNSMLSRLIGSSSSSPMASSNSGPNIFSGSSITSNNRSRSSGGSSLSRMLSPSNSGPSYSPPLQVVSSSIIARIAPSRKHPIKKLYKATVGKPQTFDYLPDVSSSLLGIKGKKGTKAARKAVGLFRPLYGANKT